MPTPFQVATLTPGLLNPSIALAASRAGELGILDFEYVRDARAAIAAVRRLGQAPGAPFGIKLAAVNSELLNWIISDCPPSIGTVIVVSLRPQDLQTEVRLLHERKLTVLLEATDLEHARKGVLAGFSGLVAKGHEAGGRVADETSFILLQRFQAEFAIPIWVHGGIGLHTAAACVAGGAAGLILDSQLALTRESPLPEAIRARIAVMDGSETTCLGEQLGEAYRLYFRPDSAVVKALQSTELRLLQDDRDAHEVLAQWREAVEEKIGWNSEQDALLLGQDAAFAAPFAKAFRTVGGVLQGVRAAVRSHAAVAEKLKPLGEESPLARSHGTRYPIMQGPMTRVSDVPEFTANVAEGGALPFLALALMRGPEVRTLLAEAQTRLGSLPWGVGLLGFVPPELRQEQMEVVREYRPPFALIAGGRPDQALALEQQGTVTYLHVPSPGLLKMFVQQGARRFVFEGRECGGHVGPRTSFVLWNQMIDVLLGMPELEAKPGEFQVVFAAGIHDALSAAMVSVLAAPLAERGVQIGVLLGTAYLFTEEAVSSGAILGTFQEQARQCSQTVLLETGPGHSTRCVVTPYTSDFFQEKRRLSGEGIGSEEIRMTLEDLNLGRLRMASKGLTRNANHGEDPTAPKLIKMSELDQLAQGMYMIGQVAALRNEICRVEDLHREVSVASSARLEGLSARVAPPPAPQREKPSDIAVIGMSCVLPKAPHLEAFWENILNKVDAITEVPKERWDPALHFDPDPKAKDKIYSRWGGFLDDVVFDPMQYGMPPSTLRSIEPSQLLTLEVVRAALEDAGYADREFPRDRTSVILGAGGGAADLGLAYGARSFLPNLEELPEFQGRSEEIVERLGSRLPEWTEDSFAGILTNVSAGRVANRFDLGGSNYTVDAACASSLAAVSLALKELEGRTSDMVIVGGIDTMQNPFTYLCFSKTHALSPRGRCRTFDESADGIAISEGIAVMVFKRLEDAERDGDRIYAVIKGAGSSSDGKDRGLTAPRPEGQARALRRAYAKAGFSPSTVGLVEAHGTGTVAGDGAEVQALTTVFSEFGAERQGCAIGSVKSMVGHTKCSAGAVGLIKTALALHHKVLPPTLGVERPNPRAHFPETPFFVNTQVRPWLAPRTGEPRRAGVSAFGFGGTNFHVVLEEYTGDRFGERQDAQKCWPEELFLFAGESLAALVTAVGSWQRALAAADPGAPLHDLAYTAWKQAEVSSSKPGCVRLAVVASSRDDLRQKLALASESLERSAQEPIRSAQEPISDPRGIYVSGRTAVEGKVAFLFPGQGSQYPHMLQDLLVHFPELQQVFERASRVLSEKFKQPLDTFIFPPPSFDKEEERSRQQALTATHVAQPALGAAGLAMFTLLGELGIHPAMLAGHSYGEYVALAAAGVFDADALFALSEARGRFIVESAVGEAGTMAAVEAEPEAVSAALEGLAGVSIANVNAPRQTVIAGTKAGVESAIERLAAQGKAARPIPVACAFHSALMAPAQPHLGRFLAELKMGSPRIAVYSNTTAKPHAEAPSQIAAQLVEHLVAPVQFAREIEAMYEDGARIFVEVGPRAVLTGLVERILPGRPKVAVASNQSAKPGLAPLLHCVAQLAAQGVPVQLDRLFRGRAVRQVDLNAPVAKAKPVSPSAWLVNGARAKPVKEATVATPAQPKSAAPAKSAGRPGPVQVPVQAPIPAPIAKPVPTPPPAAPVFSNGFPHPPVSPTFMLGPQPESVLPDGVAQVMTQFQHMMSRFLETQQAVMLSYLGVDARPGISPSLPVSGIQAAAALPEFSAALPPRSATAAVPPQFSPAFAPPAPIPAEKEAPETAVSVLAAPPAAPVSAGPNAQELTSQLLAIVSERTGYPAEMLELNLDLEADLGIDSIKRVEILGTFQQTFAASGVSFGDGMIEKLSGVRTLQGIVDRVLEPNAPPPTALPPTSSSPQAPPAEPRIGKEEMTRSLLAIVSERTGYPPEMLGLDLDLEADLGVDSIKRVEILGTFQQSLASAGFPAREGMLEQLSSVRTLRGIVDRMELEEGGAPPDTKPKVSPAPGPDQPAQSQESDPGRKIARFVPTPVDRPLSAKGKRSWDNTRVVLITDDGGGVALAAQEQLASQGRREVLVGQGSETRELEPGRYAADLGSPHSIADLIALVNQKHGPLGGVMHLAPLAAQNTLSAIDVSRIDVSTTDAAFWRERMRLGARSLFLLSQAAGPQLRGAGLASGASLLVATGMGGTFLCGGVSDALPSWAASQVWDQGGLAGLAKTLALEWPEVQVKAVDLNPTLSVQARAAHLVDEIVSADSLPEVGYDGHRRITLESIAAPLNTTLPARSLLDSSSVILITGGARGIAARAAHHYAEVYQPTLLLVGRSPLPAPEESAATASLASPKELKAALMGQMSAAGEPVTPARVEQAYTRLKAEREIRANLAGMRQLGAKVHYYQTDVRDPAAFGGLIDSLYASFGRIHGVIHAAGVIEDKLVQDKTVESFDRVFDTKVASAFLLSQKLRPDSLKFLVFFSSVSGRFGNRGQGDYAAANEVLNKLAVTLDRAWAARVVALNWGPWDNGGMVSAEVRKQFAERGVEVIPPAVGLRLLEEELQYGSKGQPEVVIGGAGWQTPKPGVEVTEARPLLRHAIASQEGERRQFVWELDPAYDRYLEDHRIDGQPVLPLAVASEILAEAAARSWPGMTVTTVRDLRVLQGIVLENGPKTIRIVVTPHATPHATPSLDRLRAAAEITSAVKPHRVHYRATLELAEHMPESPQPHPVPLTDGGPFRMEIAELYRKWLFHGPMLQGIIRVDQVGASGISAVLAVSQPADLLAGAAEGSWWIDPLTFDSALQLLVLWGREQWDMTALPSGFECLQRFGAPTGSLVRCEMRIRPETGGQNIHADVYFYDASSRELVAVLEDMQGACSKALNRLAGAEALLAAGTHP